MFRATSSLLIALSLAGCAAPAPRPYQTKTTDSEALSVMTVAGFRGLKDAELPADAIAPDKGGPTLLGGLGYSLLGNGLLGFASWMAVDDSNPAGTSRGIAWVPKSLAPTEARAEALIGRLLNEALTAAARSDLPAHYSLHKSERFPDHQYTNWIRGAACDAEYANCGVIAYKTRDDINGTKFDDVMAPGFLGGAPSFIKRQNRAYGWMAGGTTKESLFSRTHYVLDIPGFEIALKASAQLPEWVYLYAAPMTLSYQDGDARKMLPYPVVFHQGKALYFVKPLSPEKM